MSMPGQYGYNHRARVIGPGEVEGTYFVEVQALAPNSRLGPFPSVVPGMTSGDRVLLAQIGTTRGDLVIVGKLPGDFPAIGDVPGLTAALAAKANETDLVALTSRMGTDEAAITANASAVTALQGRATTDEAAITANSTAITALQSRATADEASITANSASITALITGQREGFGNDYDINHDYLSTFPRALTTTAITLTNGIGFYAKMAARQAMTLNVIKFCLNGAGVGGTLALGLWHGPNAAALSYVGSFAAGLGAGRQDWSSIGVALAAGDLVVVGFLALGMSTSPTIGSTPPVNASMLNQDATVLTSVSTTATLAALPTSALNMAILTGYTALGQIPWLAGSP